jgi:DNA-binding response OmpR family regulator
MALVLIEDHPRLRASLCRGLNEAGFEVEGLATGQEALARLSRRDVDAAVLDLGLPDVDGMEVLSRSRAAGLLAPVLVLTARDAVEARVEALDRGADDYLVKPFAFSELLARIRALLRRAAAPRWAPLAFGDVSVSADPRVVRAAEHDVPLTPSEHRLLGFLLRRRGDTATRADILREVFGYDFDPGTNLVEVHLAHLRRKLGATAVRIETVRGAGYRLSLPEGASRDP